MQQNKNRKGYTANTRAAHIFPKVPHAHGGASDLQTNDDEVIPLMTLTGAADSRGMAHAINTSLWTARAAEETETPSSLRQSSHSKHLGRCRSHVTLPTSHCCECDEQEHTILLKKTSVYLGDIHSDTI